MSKVTKRLKTLLEKVDSKKEYSLDEAISTVKGLASAKFDETVELALCLNVDPRHADQMVRGSVVLPAGTGKKVRVAVIAKDAKAEREAIQDAKDKDREERRKFKQDLKNKKRSIKNKLKEMSIKTETAKRKVAHEEVMANFQRQLDRLNGNISLIEKSKNKDAHFYEELFNKAVENTAILGISKDDNSELDECQMYVGMMLYKEDGSLIQPEENGEDAFQKAMMQNFAERYAAVHNMSPNPFLDGNGKLKQDAEDLLKEEMKKIPGLNKAFDAVKDSGSVEDALNDFLQIEPAAELDEREEKLKNMQDKLADAQIQRDNEVKELDEQAKLAETVIQNNICRNLNAKEDMFTKDGKYVKKGEKYYEVATGKEVGAEAVKDQEFKKIGDMEEESIPDGTLTDENGQIKKETLEALKERGIIPKECKPEGDGPYDLASLDIPGVDSADALKAKVGEYNEGLSEKNETMRKTIEEKVNKSKSDADDTYNAKRSTWKRGLKIGEDGDINVDRVKSIQEGIEGEKQEAVNKYNDAAERIFKDSDVTPVSMDGIDTELEDIGKKRARGEEARNEASQRFGSNATKEFQKRKDAENGIYKDVSLSEYSAIRLANKKDDLKADDIEKEVDEEYTYIDDNGKNE